MNKKIYLIFLFSIFCLAVFYKPNKETINSKQVSKEMLLKDKSVEVRKTANKAQQTLSALEDQKARVIVNTINNGITSKDTSSKLGTFISISNTLTANARFFNYNSLERKAFSEISKDNALSSMLVNYAQHPSLLKNEDALKSRQIVSMAIDFVSYQFKEGNKETLVDTVNLISKEFQSNENLTDGRKEDLEKLLISYFKSIDANNLIGDFGKYTTELGIDLSNENFESHSNISTPIITSLLLVMRGRISHEETQEFLSILFPSINNRELHHG